MNIKIVSKRTYFALLSVKEKRQKLAMPLSVCKITLLRRIFLIEDYRIVLSDSSRDHALQYTCVKIFKPLQVYCNVIRTTFVQFRK